MEKKRKKETDKEEEKMRHRDRKRPAWRDDEDSGEEPPEIRNRDWGRRGDSSRQGRSSRLLGHLKSSSPDSVSGWLAVFVKHLQVVSSSFSSIQYNRTQKPGLPANEGSRAIHHHKSQRRRKLRWYVTYVIEINFVKVIL